MKRSLQILIGAVLLATATLACGRRPASTPPPPTEGAAGQQAAHAPGGMASATPAGSLTWISAAIEPENAGRLQPAGQAAVNGPGRLVWSSDSQTLGVATRDGLMLFDTATLAVTANVVVQPPLTVLDFSAERGVLALSADQQGVEIRQITTGQALLSFHAAGPFTQAAFSPDGSLLALARADQKQVEVWDIDSGALQTTLGGFEPAGAAEHLAFSPDGRFLIWQAGRALQVIEYFTEELGPLLEQEDAIRAVAASPDGRFLAAATAGAVERQLRPIIDLWNPMSGQGLGLLLTGEHFAASLAYNPSSRVLAAAVGQKILLWDTASRLQLAELNGAGAGVNALAFSPDGSLLGASAADNTLRLWRVGP